MAKKRSNGEGSITKTPNGAWRAQIAIHGKRHSFNAKSQSECREWLHDIRNRQAEGFDLSAGSITLRGFISRWLTTIKGMRSANTVENYTWVLQPVIQSIGSISLADLRPDLFQSLYGRMLEQGDSAHAVNKVYKVLHVAMEHAVKIKLIPNNPVSPTSPPIPKYREMAFFDEDQVQTLLLSAELSGNRFYPLYYLAIYTGMREGELLGLKWSDVDWDRRTVSVRRTLVYRRGGGFEFSSPKTANALRTVLIGEDAIDILRQQRATIGNLRFAKGHKWNEYELVFPSTIGTPVHPANLRRSFRKLLELAGLPHIRFHDLRHTAATLMLNHGVPPFVVSKRLGHAKPSFTMDVYGHLIPSSQEQAVQLMDEIMTFETLLVTPKLPLHDPKWED